LDIRCRWWLVEISHAELAVCPLAPVTKIGVAFESQMRREGRWPFKYKEILHVAFAAWVPTHFDIMSGKFVTAWVPAPPAARVAQPPPVHSPNPLKPSPPLRAAVRTIATSNTASSNETLSRPSSPPPAALPALPKPWIFNNASEQLIHRATGRTFPPSKYYVDRSRHSTGYVVKDSELPWASDTDIEHIG